MSVYMQHWGARSVSWHPALESSLCLLTCRTGELVMSLEMRPWGACDASSHAALRSSWFLFTCSTGELMSSVYMQHWGACDVCLHAAMSVKILHQISEKVACDKGLVWNRSQCYLPSQIFLSSIVNSQTSRKAPKWCTYSMECGNVW